MKEVKKSINLARKHKQYSTENEFKGSTAGTEHLADAVELLMLRVEDNKTEILKLQKKK